MPITVRAVGPAEVDLCRRLGAIAVQAYVTLPGHVEEPEYELELADVAGRAAMRATEVLAAFDGDRPLGCLTYVSGPDSPMVEHDDPDAASFRMLGIDPAAQGRGAGRLLVAACVDRARAEGRSGIVLHSTPWMTAAHRLYEGVGFRRSPSLDWSPLSEVPLLGFRLDLA
jgi:ribosomal protein S18 acetylase RimI-like enzyme